MNRAGSSLKEMEPKTRDGVLQTGLSSLSAWDGDRIERATRKSDWSPLDLNGGKIRPLYLSEAQRGRKLRLGLTGLHRPAHPHADLCVTARGAPPILFSWTSCRG